VKNPLLDYGKRIVIPASKHQAMKDCRLNGGKAPHIQTLALDNERSVSQLLYHQGKEHR